MITHVCFDADDTLWENGKFFALAEQVLEDVLSRYDVHGNIAAHLLETETMNVPTLGYGVKSYTLSLIETALHLSSNQISASDLKLIIDAGRAILQHPIELPDDLINTLETLGPNYTLSVITKGDLVDQNHKLDRSNLRKYFDHIHVVMEKDAPTYKDIFLGFGVDPSACLMIGNSMKSDVLPALGVGAWGVYMPHDVVWALERATTPRDEKRYRTIETISQLPALIDCINGT